MKIPFTEPTAPRYIYINPSTNLIHLLVPVVKGETIGTDNTCKTTAASDEFFNGAALRELNAYKSALEFDLQLLGNDHVTLRDAKQQRLIQIDAYIAATPAMQKIYKNAITAQIQIPSNLYSIQLRPRIQDPDSPVVNSVFNINRKNDTTGTPLSALYNALYKAFPGVSIVPLNPRKKLEDSVKAELATKPQPINFETIQTTLADTFLRLFGLTVDFKHDSTVNLADVTKASIDESLGYKPETPATTEDYTEALLSVCAPDIWLEIPTSKFYSCDSEQDDHQTEQLSIMTQFFLAHVNIHCAENNISTENFGVILDSSDELSEEVAGIIVSALGTGANVEESLCTFFNKHTSEFGLSRPLSLADTDTIKQRFATNHTTIINSPHFDDFMILNTATNVGKFVAHQYSICTDFSELVVDSSLDNPWFQTMRADFEAPDNRPIAHQNAHIKASIDLEIDKLLSRVTDEKQLDRLDPKTRITLNKSPDFQSQTFLLNIAHGKQEEAKRQIEANPALFLDTRRFTDYSGRTFNCTGYEYAYWAKDTHMCRMLEALMDESTKALMLESINAIDKDGLSYEQQGESKKSKHFNLEPLLAAMQDYVDQYNQRDRAANKDACMRVGLAQCDLPVHVVNEYCRPDRSFDPTPEFSEASLPRISTYYRMIRRVEAPLFPLVVSATTGLGVDFALRRTRWATALGVAAEGAANSQTLRDLVVDAAAVRHLDEVRTNDLKLSRQNLLPIEPAPGRGLRP